MCMMYSKVLNCKEEEQSFIIIIRWLGSEHIPSKVVYKFQRNEHLDGQPALLCLSISKSARTHMNTYCSESQESRSISSPELRHAAALISHTPLHPAVVSWDLQYHCVKTLTLIHLDASSYTPCSQREHPKSQNCCCCCCSLLP